MTQEYITYSTQYPRCSHRAIGRTNEWFYLFAILVHFRSKISIGSILHNMQCWSCIYMYYEQHVHCLIKPPRLQEVLRSWLLCRYTTFLSQKPISCVLLQRLRYLLWCSIKALKSSFKVLIQLQYCCHITTPIAIIRS